jgi:predicted nuclease of restriction endonuclease-like RecB superfamily
MLTGNLVRVRTAKNRLIPLFLDVTKDDFRNSAEQMIEIFRDLPGRSRSEMEAEIEEYIGTETSQLLYQGLTKLLEDRCEFEVEAAVDPAAVRERAFRLAGLKRQEGAFNRDEILTALAQEFSTTFEEIDRALFADLKSEQRIVSFDNCTVDQLLNRYNVALVQAILFRATHVSIRIRGETPARYRQLFRSIKFHRLMCHIKPEGNNTYLLTLDGPLSLFSATQKYGLQLANFLPAILHCKQFTLNAEVRWGAERKEKMLTIDQGDGLKSHTVDYGDYIPKDLAMFGESFKKVKSDWELSTEPEVVELASGIWIPDFVLIHKPSKKHVPLDIFGFWRRADVEKHYRRLAHEYAEPFILAVSEQMNTDEAIGDDLDARIYRFKRTPIPGEVIRLAEAQLPPSPKKPSLFK